MECEKKKPARIEDSAGREVEIIPGCIICKTCEFHAPEVFILREKALVAEVINPRPTPEQMPGVIEAIRLCPERVIKFRRKPG